MKSVSIRTWCALAAVQAVAWVPPSARAEEPGVPLGPEAEAVLEKYPSPEDVADQIRQLKIEQPGLVEQVLADFDLSIRSSLTLEAPHTPTARKMLQRRHVLPRDEPTPGRTYRRETLERAIEELRNNPEGAERLAFYEAHLEELVLDDDPQLGLIMMHVLAFGWDDWSAWDPNDDRLNRARRTFPDLHRINALRVLPADTPATGVILRSLLDDGISSTLANDAFIALWAGAHSDDGLRFCVHWALRAPNTTRGGLSLWTQISTAWQRMLPQTGGPSRAQAFWEPYLDSDVPTLWYCAQKAFVRPVPGGFEWLNTAQADWNYEHEPDPIVRRIIDLRGQIAEIRKDVDPVTNRISLDQLAEIQALQAEVRRLEEQEHPPQPE